jgi:hypothetical protein
MTRALPGRKRRASSSSLGRRAARLLYLSLSDFVQHAHLPGDPAADAFHQALDARVVDLVEWPRSLP